MPFSRFVRRRLLALLLLLGSPAPVFPAGQRVGKQAKTSSIDSSLALERIADLDFDTAGIRDGLPHQSVYGAVQDSRGFLWVATYGGLSRFDGYHFRNYVHSDSDPKSLFNNNVRVILPARNGDLWIGTDDAGVFAYRAATDSFEALPGLPASLVRSRVYALAADGDQAIWIGGQFGLVHFDTATARYELFPTAGGTGGTVLPLKQVFAVYKDRAGNIWVGGTGGVLVRRSGSPAFTPVLGTEGAQELGTHPSVWSFFEDHAGSIWVGCDHVGVGRYDPDANVLRGVTGLAGTNSIVGAHTVRGIIERSPGQIWIATYGGGLVTFAVQDGHTRFFRKDPAKPFSSAQ